MLAIPTLTLTSMKTLRSRSSLIAVFIAATLTWLLVFRVTATNGPVIADTKGTPLASCSGQLGFGGEYVSYAGKPLAAQLRMRVFDNPCANVISTEDSLSFFESFNGWATFTWQGIIDWIFFALCWLVVLFTGQRLYAYFRH